MASDSDEEARLRAVALQNAQSILVARRRAEEALRQQSEWLRITLASIGDAVITTDAEGRVTSMNAVAQALTGWSQTDALGHFLTDVFQIVHEETRQPVENPAIRALQTNTIIRLANHTVLLARTGEEHPIDDSAAPIRDESGATVGAVLVFRDVSERKATDLARAHLAAIVESSEDAIVSKTLQGIILSWNKGAERLFGYTATEAVGQPVTMLIPSERLDEEQQILAHIVRGDPIEHFETVRLSKDGRRIDISLTVSPIRDTSGSIVGASKVARDISRRKTLEARDRFLVELDDAVRQHSEAEAITLTAARALGEHLAVNRCAYATVEEDEDTFLLTGNFTNGVDSIVGRYTFRQFGEECLRLMRAGEPYVVADSDVDPRITEAERASYKMTDIRAVICVPIKKQGRFVAAMAVHTVSPRAWAASEVELVQRVAGRSWESIERARVTHELRESEHLYRALANSNANLSWMARPDGWIYWYNDQWYAYTGTTSGDMEGWGWERVHDPAMLPIVKERWQQSIESGTPFEMVFPLRGADGAFRRFLTRVNPVRDSRGDVVHWFGTNTDVETERRTADANAELRERERLAREDAELQKRLLYSLFMQAPTLIAVLRGPNHVVEEERWQQSIDSGTPFEMVFPLRGADGAFRRFLTRVNPVRDSRGDVVHWFGTNTDVETERRTAEANAALRERERLAREDAELQKRLLYSLFMQAPTLIACTSRAAARGRARESADVRNLGTHGGRAPEPSAAGCLDGTARPGLSVATGRGVPHRHSLRRQGDGRPAHTTRGIDRDSSFSTSSTPRSGMSKAKSRGSLSSHRT